MANGELQLFLIGNTLAMGQTPPPEMIEEAGKLSPEEAREQLEGWMRISCNAGRLKLAVSFCKALPMGLAPVEIARWLQNRNKTR